MGGGRGVGAGSPNYDRLAETYAAYRTASPIVVDHIMSELAVRPESILEIGCGTANHLWALSQSLSATGSGFDKSTGMLKEAGRQHASLLLRLGDAERSFPYGDQEFCLAFAVDVIHLIQNLERFFREAFRVLAPGGICVIATNSDEDIQRGTYVQYFPEALQWDLARFHPVSRLLDCMSTAGFERVWITRAEQDYAFDELEMEAFRKRTYSVLRLISARCFQAGMGRLESDFSRGTAVCRDLYTFAWGARAPARSARSVSSK